MSKEIAKQDGLLTPDTITKDDVKRLFCANATDKELTMFLQIAKLNQLNPLKREIYLVKYKVDTPASILTGYEVYLKRAERSGKYLGFKVWIEGTGEEMKACIEVRHKDWNEPLYHEVDYSEYVQMRWDKVLRKQVPNKFWKEKPKTMLKKVAISQGLRFAFPDELAGLPYVREEINPEEVVDIKPNGKPAITPPEAIEEHKPEAPQALSEPQEAPKQTKATIEPPKKKTELKTKPVAKSYQQRFTDAQKAIGESDYRTILGKFGYKNRSEIKSKAKADEVLKALEGVKVIADTFSEEPVGGMSGDNEAI